MTILPQFVVHVHKIWSRADRASSSSVQIQEGPVIEVNNVRTSDTLISIVDHRYALLGRERISRA